MKFIWIFTALMSWGATVTAQPQDYPAPGHQQTSPSATARYEVLQSPLAMRWTFRLDRIHGRVWQLLKTPEDNNRWEEMPVTDLPRVRSAVPQRARFQLFASGLGAYQTFLLDMDTGKTWTVVTRQRKNADGTETEFSAWQPFSEDKALPAP